MTVIAEVEPGIGLTRNEQAPRSMALGAPINSPLELLQLAIERGLDAGQLERLAALAERMQQGEREREFAVAFAAFQNECPKIKRNKGVSFTTKGGGETNYAYAELDKIVDVVKPILQRHGLMFSWDTTQSGQMMTVTCTLRHVNSHFITSSMTLPVDNASAASPQQKYGIAQTYAERRTLSAVLGVQTSDDLDGADTKGGDAPKITEDQVVYLEDLLKETKSDRAKFLKFVKVDALSDLRVDGYDAARKALEKKRSAA